MLRRACLHPSALRIGAAPLLTCAFALLGGAQLPAQSAGGMLGLCGEHPGEVAGAQAGRRLAAAHDFDRDGARDLIATSIVPGSATEVAVFSSRSGRMLSRITLPWQHHALYGETIASVRDVDGDGVPEIAIGEQHFGTSYYDGRVSLHSGASGAVLWSVTHPDSNEHLGSGLAAAGDVNLDGFEDLLVHASWMRPLGPPYDPGGALLLSGLDGAVLRRFEVADRFHYYYGERRVASPGDVDRDGVPDLLVGGLGNQSANQPGRVVLYSGATGAVLREHVGSSAYGAFATSVAAAGDVDRDGVPDYAYSDASYDKVWIRSGATGLQLQLIERASGREFGAGLSGGRDLDGDSVPDLLVTERGSGLLHLVSGASGATTWMIGEPSGGDAAGYAACALDDADRDGRIEFAWSEPDSSLPGQPAGSGFVRVAEFVRGIEQDVPTIRASAGGTVHWTLEFPAAEAGQPYLLLASGRAATPAAFEGVVVPLAQDAVFLRMLAGAPPPFAQAAGTLDASGRAFPSLHLAPGAGLPHLGATIWFAAVTGPAGARRGSSVAVPLTIIP